MSLPRHPSGRNSGGVCGDELRIERSLLRASPGLAALLARVFSADLRECAACSGLLKIIAALTDPAWISLPAGSRASGVGPGSAPV